MSTSAQINELKYTKKYAIACELLTLGYSIQIFDLQKKIKFITIWLKAGKLTYFVIVHMGAKMALEGPAVCSKTI